MKKIIKCPECYQKKASMEKLDCSWCGGNHKPINCDNMLESEEWITTCGELERKELKLRKQALADIKTDIENISLVGYTEGTIKFREFIIKLIEKRSSELIE